MNKNFGLICWLHKWRIPLLGLASVVVLFFLPDYLRLVEVLGRRIPQTDIRTDYLTGVGWAVFLGFTICVWPVPARDKKALLRVWAVKCFVMLFLMLFYEYHYQVDSFGYFAQAGLEGVGWSAVYAGEARPNVPVTLVTLLHHYSHWLDSFHAIKISFGMIGLVGVYFFYRGASEFLNEDKIEVLYLLGLFPSILFWSSILGKEPFVLFSIALYSYGVMLWMKKQSLRSALTLLTGLSCAAFVRPWLGYILALPVFIVTLIFFIKPDTRAKVIFLSVLVLISCVFSETVMSTFSMKSFSDLPKVASQKYVGFARGGSTTVERPKPEIVEKPVAAVTAESAVKPQGRDSAPPSVKPSAGSHAAASQRLPEAVNPAPPVAGEQAAPAVEITESPAVIEPPPVPAAKPVQASKQKYRGFTDMLFFIPKGMFTSLFRPLPGEVKNPFGILAGIEGGFLLVLFIFALKGMRWRDIRDPVFVWALLLIVLWSGAYAFVSFNLGTVSRYRLQILPVFLGFLVYYARRKV